MSQPEFHVRLALVASVAPSEDPAKVRAAMASVLGESAYAFEEGTKALRATSVDPKSIRKLHDQLRDRHVRGAARRLLLSGREGDTVTVMLNRQAAFGGVLALCGSAGESPLGPLYLTIESKQMDAVVKWLTAYESE